MCLCGDGAGLGWGDLCERSPPRRPTAQFEAHPPSSSRAMELQKRAFELVVENMLPGLDVELGAFEELLNIFGTSRLANRRRVLQWVGTHYLVVGAAKLNELRRVQEELEEADAEHAARMATWLAYHRRVDEAEMRRAELTCDRLNEEKSRLLRFFGPRLTWVHNRVGWAWMADLPVFFWQNVLAITLTRWSRLRD